MWSIMITVFLAVSYFDTIELREKNNIKHLIIYGIMMTISCTLGILIGANVDIPSPADYIKAIVTMIIGK